MQSLRSLPARRITHYGLTAASSSRRRGRRGVGADFDIRVWTARDDFGPKRGRLRRSSVLRAFHVTAVFGHDNDAGTGGDVRWDHDALTVRQDRGLIG